LTLLTFGCPNDQLFPWKSYKRLKKARSNLSSEEKFYKQEGFVCYNLITSVAFSIFTTYHFIYQ